METLTFQRFEFKYLISEPQAEEIRKFIAPYAERDEYSERNPRKRYTINNVYFDTLGLRFFREHRDKFPDRFKLRARAYGPESDVFLEVKRKVKQTMLKTRVAVARDRLADILNGDFRPGLEGE